MTSMMFNPSALFCAFSRIAVNENGVLTARRRAITVGQVYAGNAELTSGLSIGDKLITTGYAELTEGMAIEL